MKIMRGLVSGAFLAAVACAGFAGCAEDNDKNMMNASNAPAPSGVPAAPAAEFTPPPAGNDPEARKAYEMKRMQDSMKNGGAPISR